MRRIALVSVCVTAGIFVVANAVLWAVYRNRTYPGTTLMGANVGNTPYSSLSQKVSTLGLLPKDITLTYGDKKATVPLSEIGFRKETARTTASANQQRSWLPVYNLLSSPKLKAPVAIDSALFKEKAKNLAETFYQAPVNARVALKDTKVNITEGTRGYSLDQTALEAALLAALDANRTRTAVPVKYTDPTLKSADLSDEKQALEWQLATTITFTYEGKSKAASRSDVAAWFVVTGETYTVSSDAIKAYIIQTGNSFGIRVKDVQAMAAAAMTAITDHKAATITLAAQAAAKTYSYCIAAKGVDASHLGGLRTMLQNAFSDNRGWSLGGLVEYKEAGNCDFTVWLAEASLMPTFGAICDSMWSCRVGPNVVINFDRWQNASPAWNANGGTLQEYRYMVINHETGHWLGFGHSHCPGTGQAAPVMQQQSIDLQGCVFSAWPSANEQATLKSRLGI